MQDKQDDKPQPPLEDQFSRVISPFQTFIANQTTGSVLLIVCVLVALAVANSPWQQHYQALLHQPLGFYLGNYAPGMSLSHWINDGLMTLFFFLLGLEIKREVLVGDINKMALLLPVLGAALGGMLVPALIYSAFNADTAYASGWGIPMATDTAFAVGILALLGSRIPASAFTFLTALAIIDDLGAVVVIGVFYSASINSNYLLVSGGLLLLLGLCNLLGIRRWSVYLCGGVLVWLAMLGTGLHATIAGVLVAVTVPAHSEKDQGWFAMRIKKLVERFHHYEQQRDEQQTILAETDQHAIVEHIKEAAEKSTTPLRRWENGMEYPVALGVLPIFALANAGIAINFDNWGAITDSTLLYGVVAGLIIGKGLGIPLFVWVVLKCQWGELPEGLRLDHVVGIGLLGGMGFTMSIFIANLAFSNDMAVLLTAKMAILIASLLAGVAGFCWLRFTAGEN